MAARLIINGKEESYPSEIKNLENLLLHLMRSEAYKKEFIVDVKVDGKSYSEEYEHQSREVSLSTVNEIKINIQNDVEFATSFFEKTDLLLEHIINGFTSSANLLQDPEEEEQGYEMLARSAESLSAFKDHLANVNKTLGRSEPGGNEEYWKRFENTVNKIMDSQKDCDPLLTSDLLNDELLPLLKEWKNFIK